MAVDELRFRVMASDAQVIVVDGPPHACAAARRCVERLEAIWSRFIDSSDISRLNHGAGLPIQVEPATVLMLEIMAEAWTSTDGRYDPTILPDLVRAGYVTSIDNPDIGSTIAIDTNRPDAVVASFGQVEIGPDRVVTLPTALAIDAGGIGKGLAADLACTALLDQGASGALVSIGGDLSAAGTGPEAAGWRVDIEDPFDPTVPITQVMISGGGVATSSTRSRRWISDDETDRHHVIDPATGEPSRTDLVAVTVIAPCGWLAEAHATALLLAGSAQFHDYAADKQIEAVAITAGHTNLATDAFARILPDAVTKP